MLRRAVFAVSLFAFSCFVACSIAGAAVQDLQLEYRKNASGVYTAVFKNRHSAPATAYIAQAAFDQGQRERHASLGGDTLGFTNGEELAFPAGRETDTGRTLPGNAPPNVTRVLAVIYADGVTEGDDEVVSMLLSGRHRALADLNESIPELEKVSRPEALLAFFQAMESKDQAESASLDDLQDAPGRMRYRFFMSAVPARAVQMLQGSGSPAVLLKEFRDWQKRLAASKPDVR